MFRVLASVQVAVAPASGTLVMARTWKSNDWGRERGSSGLSPAFLATLRYGVPAYGSKFNSALIALSRTRRAESIARWNSRKRQQVQKSESPQAGTDACTTPTVQKIDNSTLQVEKKRESSQAHDILKTAENNAMSRPISVPSRRMRSLRRTNPRLSWQKTAQTRLCSFFHLAYLQWYWTDFNHCCGRRFLGQ